jgi:hypothetical protein
MSASGKNAWLDRVAANAVLTVVMEKDPQRISQGFEFNHGNQGYP